LKVINVGILGRPRSRGISLPSHTEFCHKKLVLMAAHSEDFVILSCFVLIHYSSVTDRRSDGRLYNSSDARS